MEGSNTERDGHSTTQTGAGGLDPVSALLIDSSLDLVSALREPLNAIAIEAENLALEAENLALAAEADARENTAPAGRSGPDHRSRARTARMATPHRVRSPARSHRLQRQVASVSRAITMLERVLRERSNDAPVCDLTRAAKEACCFLRAFAARNEHRLLWDERATEACWVDAPERATRLTLVVLMAERMLALPPGADLSVSVGVGPSGSAQVALDGNFADIASAEAVLRPPELDRLLASRSISDARTRISVESPARVCIRFERCDTSETASQLGGGDPMSAQPGCSSASSSASR